MYREKTVVKLREERKKERKKELRHTKDGLFKEQKKEGKRKIVIKESKWALKEMCAWYTKEKRNGKRKR